MASDLKAQGKNRSGVDYKRGEGKGYNKTSAVAAIRALEIQQTKELAAQNKQAQLLAASKADRIELNQLKERYARLETQLEQVKASNQDALRVKELEVTQRMQSAAMDQYKEGLAEGAKLVLRLPSSSNAPASATGTPTM